MIWSGRYAAQRGQESFQADDELTLLFGKDLLTWQFNPVTHLRWLGFFLIVVAWMNRSLANTQLLVGGGIHSLNLGNSLTESTFTTPGSMSSLGVELLRLVRKGRVSFGVRAEYLTTSISAGDVELKYSQIPVFGTLGYVLGTSSLRLRLNVGAGYPLVNKMTFTGSGTATDGEYEGKGLMLLSGAQILLFLGKKARLGFFAEGGYVYSFSKVLFHEPFTSEDLDGDASGIFLHGGLAYRF